MKIYNVLIKDRHCDPVIYNFTDKNFAIDFAWQNAHEGCRFPEDLKEKFYNPEKDDGWILKITYSCEVGYIRVSEGELK